MSNPAHVPAILQEPRRHRYLKLIALFKIAKGFLLLVLGVSLVFLNARTRWMDALSNWTAFEFRTYWLLGAILTVPYLAQGELYLLVPRTVANAFLIALVFGTAFAVARMRAAPLQTAPLVDQLPLGKDVFGGGSEAHRLPQLYSIPAYIVLVAGAVWSALRMRRSPAIRDRAMGTLAIAAGATIVAIGSGIGAGYGVVWLFSIGLAAGIAVMFWGFLRATSRRAHARSPA